MVELERTQTLTTTSPVVLVVEDDADTQEMLQALLTGAGYSAEVAQSGEDAFAYLDRDQADLILLDLRLPDMHGHDVCRRIREGDKGSIPIIMLTADDEQQGPSRGLRLGADDYLAKPFAPDELLARMEAVLRRRQAALAFANENEALRDMLEFVQRDLAAAQSSSGAETVLRREFLHNVTTHLHALCAVIESEFRRSPPGATREVIQRILGRVRGAALVYDISEVLQHDPVRIDHLVRTIASALKSIYSPRKRLPLAIEGGALELPVGQASALSMIVNELVTNCFKHAFPGGRFGAITIRYHLQEEMFVLQVIDDGVGMSSDNPSAGRGRTTVTQLAQSLGGCATWQSSEGGMVVTVQFPVTVHAA